MYRIYRHDGLEVRTIQDWDADHEEIGAVFTIVGHSAENKQGQRVFAKKRAYSPREQEKITKVTEFVESADSPGMFPCYNSFIVYETERGNKIVSEQLSNGTATWDTNPEDLQERSFQAKVRRSADCRRAGTTVRAMKNHQAETGQSSAGSVATSDRRGYVRRAFSIASGCR